MVVLWYTRDARVVAAVPAGSRQGTHIHVETYHAAVPVAHLPVIRPFRRSLFPYLYFICQISTFNLILNLA